MDPLCAGRLGALSGSPGKGLGTGDLDNRCRSIPGGSQTIPRIRCQAGPMAGERLLLVDDEDNLRIMLEAALRHNGYDIVPASTGREALDKAVETNPDLI